MKIDHKRTKVGTAGEGVARSVAGRDNRVAASPLTAEQVWREVAKGSFAVLGYVTPSGEPRSSGVVYKTVGRRLCVVVAPESWKARHIAASGRVSVTVPVRRGGIMSLVAPIPPATVSFHGTTTVHPIGSPQAVSVLNEMASLIPAERRVSGSVIEVTPQGAFVTYGLAVSLAKLRDPLAAGARIPVPQADTG